MNTLFHGTNHRYIPSTYSTITSAEHGVQDIVQEIIQAEKKAEELLQSAREKASGIKQSAEVEASRKVAEARARAQEIMQQDVLHAREEVERTRARRLEEAAGKALEKMRMSRKRIDSAAARIVELITQTDLTQE
jgi:vacuolar-type H+-ATPase subunit E/Vma4